MSQLGMDLWCLYMVYCQLTQLGSLICIVKNFSVDVTITKSIIQCT